MNCKNYVHKGEAVYPCSLCMSSSLVSVSVINHRPVKKRVKYGGFAIFHRGFAIFRIFFAAGLLLPYLISIFMLPVM